MRSLGRADVAVHAVGDARWDTMRRSRYCTSFTHVEPGGDLEDRWLDWLERGPRGSVVLPTTDSVVALVARHRKQLMEWGYIPFEANDDVIDAVLDKRRTHQLAEEVGVASPATVALASVGEIDEALLQVSMPCAFKPAHSFLFARHFGVRTKLFVVNDRAELESALRVTEPLGLEMLLTEIIPGPDSRLCHYATYMDERGDPLFHFTRRKVRQYPPSFGIGCYQLTKWDPEVAAAGLRLFRGIGLRGLAAVEFKHDPRDGQPKLIECNHRFTTATELTRMAGIDMPLLTYNRLVGLPLPDVASFEEGLRMWNAIEDTRSFLASRDSGDMTARQWVRSLLHPQRFPVLRLDDPGPALANYRRLLLRRRPSSGPSFAAA